jgi:hypothetical protein
MDHDSIAQIIGILREIHGDLDYIGLMLLLILIAKVAGCGS